MNDVALSKDRWEKIYKRRKSGKKENYETDPTVLSYKKFLDRYKRYFRSGIFLDLGCGIAFVSAILSKEGVSILGVDVSTVAIRKSRELFKKEKLKGKFIEADLLKLPLRDNSVSFIYSCMSLEYVKDTQGAISESYRVLKPKGIMVAIVPVISLTTLTYHQLRGDIPGIPVLKQLTEWIHIKVLKGKYMHYGYEQSFTVSKLKKMYKKAGFNVNRVDFFDMHYPIEFIPSAVRPGFKKLLKHRPFWPLVYVEARKIN